MTDAELDAIEGRYKDICYRHEDIPLLVTEVRQLRKAIRRHRDERGDDRCWMDDEALYRALPEGYAPPAREAAVELRNCERYLTCRRNPATEYVSPQREIERLTARVSELEVLVGRLVAVLDSLDGYDYTISDDAEAAFNAARQALAKEAAK